MLSSLNLETLTQEPLNVAFPPHVKTRIENGFADDIKATQILKIHHRISRLKESVMRSLFTGIGG
jgi:hypothetical protein